MLQYADDTLILLRADVEDLRCLKLLLDKFPATTGLDINFHKSTIVPLHVDEDFLPKLLDVLGCQQGTFAQTYLGLPLSNLKLNLTAFAPLISKADKYLSGWQASLLNPMCRIVLVNSELDALSTYAMCAMLLSLGLIDAMDSQRRVFLWSGEDKTGGAMCLVDWDRCCRPRSEGGLGLKHLETQNKCLLLKLLHRIHSPGESAWAMWVRERINLTTLSDDIVGSH